MADWTCCFAESTTDGADWLPAVAAVDATLAVAVDPCTSPVKPELLRFLFGIKMAKDA